MTPTWPQVLSGLVERADLPPEVASWAMTEIMSGAASPAQVAAFLALLRAKGETVEELAGLADGMLAHALPVDVPGPALDIVGTGGDRANTVNISTMASIVVAGAGVPVVKHGNRAASSQSGTADVLEALDLDLNLTPEQAADVASEVGITFLFARTFHPAMAHAAPVRSQLGIPTSFNLLGPLTSPARPAYSLIGCANLDAAPLMAGVLARRPVRAAVVRGRDGLDEATVAADSDVWWVQDGTVTTRHLGPQDVGLGTHPLDSLHGGDPAHNAAVVRSVLAGDPGPARDAVLLNAGLALAVVGEPDAGRDQDAFVAATRRGVERAARSIDCGDAADLLSRWSQATRSR